MVFHPNTKSYLRKQRKEYKEVYVKLFHKTHTIFLSTKHFTFEEHPTHLEHMFGPMWGEYFFLHQVLTKYQTRYICIYAHYVLLFQKLGPFFIRNCLKVNTHPHLIISDYKVLMFCTMPLKLVIVLLLDCKEK
jgi:hypothetical protein